MQTVAQLDLESIVKAKLPPLPGSILTISGLLQDVDVSQRKIAEAIGYDPMLASRVLRLANSPIYPFEQTITSLTTAVGAVGNRAIYEMVLLGIVTDSFGREIRNSVVGREIWLHSLAVALGAREIASMLQMRGTEESFSCGLLHDIGKLLFFRADLENYSEILSQGGHDKISEAENDYYGFDHAQLGALAAQRWNLSAPVCSIIAYHHNPSKASQGFLMTNIICVADNLAYLKNAKLPLDGEFLTSSSVTSLGLSAIQLEKVWEKIVVQLREIVRAFFA